MKQESLWQESLWQRLGHSLVHPPQAPAPGLTRGRRIHVFVRCFEIPFRSPFNAFLVGFQEPMSRSKPYELDFLPSELMVPYTEQQQLPTGASRAALRLRRGAWRRSQAMAQLARALEHLLSHAKEPVVLFSMVYGERYGRYLPGWMERARAFGLETRRCMRNEEKS